MLKLLLSGWLYSGCEILFFIHWLCYFLPVFSRLHSYLNILPLWCAGRCFPSFKVDLLLFCCQRRRVVKESHPQVSHWLLHADLFACWESVFASVLTQLCIFHCRATFQSQFSLTASPRFSGFSPSPPPRHLPTQTLWKFFTKKKKATSADVAPPGASKSMRREEPAQHADIRKTV